MAREYLVSAGESTKPKRLSIGRRGLQEPKTRGRLAGLVSWTVREKGSAPQRSQGDRAGAHHRASFSGRTEANEMLRFFVAISAAHRR